MSTTSIQKGKTISYVFSIPPHPAGAFVGFGGWFTADVALDVSIEGLPFPANKTQLIARYPNWGKVGSMWAGQGKQILVSVNITPAANGHLAHFGFACGQVVHEHLSAARAVLLKNMYQFSPEAHFYSERGTVVIRQHARPTRVSETAPFLLYMKQCNRCARFLPINIRDERLHLSFSNHCVAPHRRPCKHTGFGRLREIATSELVQLEYGYQLECRFCKKFVVNAAHNRQRTSAQMKEDGARRRSFELLLTALYGGSTQLKYRHLNDGRELAEAVWVRFKKRCFNCGSTLLTAKKMCLDHTRPLALLWPLDESATALCSTCNSQKRDRPPVEFYSETGKIEALAKITGLSVAELRDPSPNVQAVRILRRRLDWFFSDFLVNPLLTKVRDGKSAAELLVKALQKTINKCPPAVRFDLEAEFKARQ